MPEITVYAKNNCIQCKMTQKTLEANNIPFKVINLNEHPEVINDIKKRSGFSSAPIIECRKQSNIDYWFGFRPDRIRTLKSMFTNIVSAQ